MSETTPIRSRGQFLRPRRVILPSCPASSGVLGVAILLLSSLTARSEEIARFIPEAVQLSDRFETDSRMSYKTTGGVKWSTLKLSLPKDATFAWVKTIDADWTCEFDVWPSAVAEVEPSVTRLHFVLSNGCELLVVVTRANQNGQLLRQIVVALVDRASGAAEPVVEQLALSPVFTITGDVERWSLRYKNGLLAVSSDGQVVVRACCRALASWCNAIVLAQLSGDIDLTRFEVRGRTAGYTDAQRKVYEQVNALREKAERAKAVGDLKLAIQTEQQRIPLMKQAFGEQEVGIALVHEWVNDIAYSMKRFDAVKRLSSQAADAYTQSLGPDHPEALRMRVYEGYAQAMLGDLEGGERLAREAGLKYYQRAGATNDRAQQVTVHLVQIFNKQALRLLEEGKYAESQRYRADSIAVLAASHGAESDYVRAVKEQSDFVDEVLASPLEKQRDMAKLQIALIKIYDEALDSGQPTPPATMAKILSECRRVLGNEHRYTADALVSIAIDEMNAGDFGASLAKLEESVAIRKKMNGDDSVELAMAEFHLAAAYSQVERYDEATPLFKHALEAFVTAKRQRSSFYARLLLEYGRHLSRTGDYSASREQLTASVQLYNDLGLAEDPNAIVALERLANISRAEGDLSSAESILKRQQELLQQSGNRGTAYAMTLAAEAHNLFVRREFAEAAAKYQEALGVAERLYGKRSRGYETVLANLMEVYAYQNNSAGVAKTLGELLEFARMRRESLFEAYTMQQQFQQSASDRIWLARLMALAINGNMQSRDAYEHFMSIKGAVTMHQRKLNVAAVNPELRDLFTRCQQVNSQITLALGRPATPEIEQQLVKLVAEQNRLDREMSRRSAAYRSAAERLTVDRLLQILPEKMCVVDYVVFERPPSWLEQLFSGEPRRMLAAFVVSQRGGVQLVNLGPSETIDRSLIAWARAIGAESANLGPEFNPQLERAVDEAGANLRKLVWDPLRTEASGAESVLISPDGTLGYCPFAAFPLPEGGTYLIEKFAVSYLPAIGMMTEMLAATPQSTDQSLLLVDDVNYAAAEDSPSSSGETLLQFTPLPSKDAEIRPIRRFFDQRFPRRPVVQLTQKKATETQFRAQSQRATIVHLSTHGFSLPLSELIAPDASTSEANALDFDPLISGVALAGANHSTYVDGLSDGILWASEISTLDLSGVDLITLSACQTAAGDVIAGEGLQGAQRALLVAGARTSLTSLWSVEQEATRSVMEHFYRSAWAERRAKSDAIRAAMVYMLREYPWWSKASSTAKGRRCPPWLWSSWVLYGDWR